MFGHYPSSIAINLLDILAHIGYEANKIAATTLSKDAYLTDIQQKALAEITQQRVDKLQSIMNDYYNGKI